MEEKKYRISTEESLLSKLFLTYLGLMDEEGNKKLVSEAKYYLEKVRDIPKGYGETRELPW